MTFRSTVALVEEMKLLEDEARCGDCEAPIGHRRSEQQRPTHRGGSVRSKAYPTLPRMFIKVDLPVPEAPMMLTNSPSSMRNDIYLSSTSVVIAPLV